MPLRSRRRHKKPAAPQEYRHSSSSSVATRSPTRRNFAQDFSGESKSQLRPDIEDHLFIDWTQAK